jgi:hypothetical protein
MRAKFKGAPGSSLGGLITCKIGNAILEPFFGEKPVRLGKCAQSASRPTRFSRMFILECFA